MPDPWGRDLTPIGSRWARPWGKRIMIYDVIGEYEGLARVRRPDLGPQSSNYEEWISKAWLTTKCVRLPDPLP